MLRLTLLSGVLLMLSCTNGKDTAKKKRDTHDTGPVGDICPEACAGLGDLYVCTGATDGDGSWEAPFSSVSDALASLDEGGKTIAIGAGTYSDNLTLQAHSSVTLLGCGPDEEEVLLTAAESDAPLIDITGVQDIVLSDLSLEGGRRGIQVWQGATVDLNNIDILSPVRVGIVIDGGSTFVTASDVWVYDVQTSDGEYGYGISVQNSSRLYMVNGGVVGAVGAGILVTGTITDTKDETVLTGVTVSEVSPGSDSALGRGIVLQDGAQTTLSGVIVSECHDAGIFGLGAVYVSVEGKSSIDGTTGDKKTTAGDGVVISRGDTKTDPQYFFGQVVNSTITSSTRAGIVLDGVNVIDIGNNTLSGNTTYTNADGDKTSIVAQNGTMFQTPPSASYLEVVDVADALQLNIEALQLDITEE